MFLLADPDGPGKALWDLICNILCEDLCQPSDLSVVLHEQKSILVQAFSVLQALYRCQEQWCSKMDSSKMYNSSAVLSKCTIEVTNVQKLTVLFLFISYTAVAFLSNLHSDFCHLLLLSKTIRD